MSLLYLIILINKYGIFLHKTKNLKPPSTLARNLIFVMFMSSDGKVRFDLNVGRHETNLKPYITHPKENGATLGRVS